MKQQTAFCWLIPMIAILAAIIASVGLFSQAGDGPFPFTTIHGNTIEMYGEGLYRNDSLFVGGLFRGTDAITLFVSLRLLLVGYPTVAALSVETSLSSACSCISCTSA